MIKTAFCTCVHLGLSCIEKVYEIGGKFDLFITYKDEKARDKSGRIYLDDIARKHGVPVLKIDNINDPEAIEAIKKHEIDWLFIIGWSQIAHREILEAPHYGCIGMHPMLLPKGRGRAAIPWAILKGLDKTGVTMFKLDEGVDTGDIIAQGSVDINDNTTATELYSKIDELHTRLIAENWTDIVNDCVKLTPQDDSQAAVWEGRRPEDGEITCSMTMLEADRMVRAVTHPYPGAFYKTENSVLRIWSAKVNKDKGLICLKDGYLEPIDYEEEHIRKEALL